MENFSAAVTFMRANPPTKGHFLIVKELHNLDVDKKYIYLSHSQDSKKNPLPYYEKYSFMKTFVNEKYNDIEVVNSEARTLLDALYEIYNKGCNDITIVLGSDRIEDFSILVNKYNGQINKKTGNLFYQFNNIDFVQAGNDRDESSDDELSSISATKQRKLATEGNYEEFSKGVPTEDPYLKKELYNTLRQYMKAEELKEGLFDKITKAFQGEPVEKYYEVGPIIYLWYSKEANKSRYEVEWWDFSLNSYTRTFVYHPAGTEIEKDVKYIGVVSSEFREVGKYDKVLYSTVKVIYKNEKTYEKSEDKIIEFLKTHTNPNDFWKRPLRMDLFYELPTYGDLKKEGLDSIPEVKETVTGLSESTLSEQPLAKANDFSE